MHVILIKVVNKLINNLSVICLVYLLSVLSVSAESMDKPSWVDENRWVGINDNTGIEIIDFPDNEIAEDIMGCLKTNSKEMDEACKTKLTQIGRSHRALGYLFVKYKGIWIAVTPPIYPSIYHPRIPR